MVSEAAIMVPWVCTAPFGRPVVPEVYMMKSRSSSVGRAGRRRRAGAASRSAS